MSFKPQFLADGEWCSNGQAFATKDEAEKSAYHRFMLWTLPIDYRAIESEQPVNYKWVDAVGDVMIKEG